MTGFGAVGFHCWNDEGAGLLIPALIAFSCPYLLSPIPFFFIFLCELSALCGAKLLLLKALEDWIPDQKTSGMTGFGAVSHLLLFLASIS